MKISVWCKKHEAPAEGMPFFIPTEGHTWELDLSEVCCSEWGKVECTGEDLEVRKEEG